MVVDYPRFFTPNEDGFNDTWNITELETTAATIYIFDRTGKLLKQLSPEGDGWDGTHHGAALPATDYWFLVEYEENGVMKKFKSHFALKR
jgi:gliding motility-associated-like protein